MRGLFLVIVVALVLSSEARASDTITLEPNHRSYHYVSHYSVAIGAPVEVVWEHLINLGSWMYEFEMALASGTPGEVGEVRRLFAEQDFFVQITKIIPNELLVFANLPSTFKGEFSTGIGVITLHESRGTTTVNMTMSRRYSWESEGLNPQKKTRESQEFSQNTRAMWQDRFLAKLRSLAEA